MINPLDPDFANLPLSSNRPARRTTPSGATGGIPTISILTPFFNTDDVFLETADCILNQSFADWEWLIVDDGSTEPDAVERLKTVASADSRIRVIRQDNGGPAAARNTAFDSSCGRYLCLIDSDDLIEPTYLEICLWFLESQPEFGFCNAYSVIFGSEQYLWTTGFEQGRNHLKANSGPPISVLRRETFEKAGGFDKDIVFGHEDWDFWLRVASHGIWGHTIPEYLQWYRKRSSGRFHQVMSDQARHADFENLMQSRYAAALETFPTPRMREALPYETVDENVPFPCKPRVAARSNSALFLFPWMVTGGADRVNLDWIEYLRTGGWEVSVCSTLESYHDWQSEFARYTVDIFVLSRFLHRTDYLRFIVYLVESRSIDIVVISGSTAGYLLLPYLRARFPDVAFVDLCHVEEPHWLNGGHPRFAVGYQAALHANIVTTGHLRDWMVERGADAPSIDVCYTGASIPDLPSEVEREAVRERHGLSPELPLIVFGGRLTAQKRPLLLIEILGELFRQGLAFNAVIVGDGDLRETMETRCEALRFGSKVRFTGSLPHSAWLDVLGAADLLLMPSAYEGISVALYEAMARGVVPVVGRVGGQAEVVGEQCGALIAPSDTELKDYSDAVARYLTNAEVRREASIHARQRIVSGFSKHAGGAAFVSALQRARTKAHDDRTSFSLRLGHEIATQGFEYLRMSALADFLWARRDARAVESEAIFPPIANRTNLSRGSRILIRLRVSWLGVRLSRVHAARLAGRRLLEWLERKPGF